MKKKVIALNKKSLFSITYIGAMLLALSVFTGFRGESFPGDTETYSIIYYSSLKTEGFYEIKLKEIAFIALMKFFNFITLSVEYFFSFISFMTSAIIMIAFFNLNKIMTSKNSGNSGYHFIYLFLALALSPFYYSAILNGIRQGLAIALLFLAYSCFLQRKNMYAIFFSVVASGFHYFSAPFAILWLLGRLSSKHILALILTLSVFYSLEINQLIINNFFYFFDISAYNIITSYGKYSAYKSGTRLDFLLFSLMLGAFLYMLSYHLPRACKSKYINIVKYYFINLIPFLLFGYGAYSNRLLMLSWIFFSIAISLAIANSKYIIIERYFIYCFFIFTNLMALIIFKSINLAQY